MIDKDDSSMKNEWTRDDLPHQHEVWDDFVAGKHSDVFHAVDEDDLGEVLDEIVDYLNAHHPKPQQYDCGETIDALNRNRDALIENRDKSISSLQRLLANTECHEDRWRRAHEIVERERDEARAERDEAERERNEMQHTAIKIAVQRDKQQGRAESAERERDEWKARAEAAEARTAPAVTREEVAAVEVRLASDGWYADGAWLASADETAEWVRDRAAEMVVCAARNEAVARAIETEAAVDPVEAKARDLWILSRADTLRGFDSLTSERQDEYRRLARHVLGQEAGR